jgi:MFS family permease
MQEKSYAVDEKTLKRSVLLVTAFAAFLTPFLGSAINLALPAISKDLNASAIELGWIASSFILSSAMFLLPFGRLADITGRKKIFMYGISLFTLSTFLIIFSWNIESLIIFRIIQGISGAMIFGTSLAILTSVFGPGERGRAMGINITAVYTGLSGGPVIGGLLTQHFGWRSIFIFLVPLGIVSLYLIIKKIRSEWAEAKGEKFDWKGSVIYGISMASSMYGFSKLPSVGGWIFLGTGLIFGLLFLFFEKGIGNPVFDIRLMIHNRIFAFSGIAALIHYSATSATGFFISLYLQYIKGLDARTAGFVMISQPVMMALLSPLAGKLSDKYNPGIIASSGMGHRNRSDNALFCKEYESAVSDHRSADHYGHRFWPFFLTKFQCHHEFCGEKASWCSIRSSRDNAYDRPDAQHGHSYDAFGSFYRTGGNCSHNVSRTDCRNADRFYNILLPLHPWDFCFARKEQKAFKPTWQ